MRDVRRSAGLGSLALAWSLAALALAPLAAQPPTGGNRLADAASPYLRQHGRDPVDWYPWSEAAFEKARREQKPIFLSIGYSACHWCHVMAAESFRDAATAQLLNDKFVCIKVDREERPDVDDLYMAALQAMGQSGGWPLSAWLFPDGRPFFAGTYFPPSDQRGLPGFRRVCEQLDRLWRERRGELEENAKGLASHLREVLAPASVPGEPSAALLGDVAAAARERFDAEHGGFGAPPRFAPKFPSPLELAVLLRLDDPTAHAMVTTTLRAMARGGLHDQLGGGFHRYTVDRAWRVPHFEKMLYDNALLAGIYLEAGAKLGDAEFTAVGTRTLDWLLREMRGPHGGFFASQDAQSEGHEGRFFVWTKAEVDALLGERSASVSEHFGITAEGNFEGRNVLFLPHGPAGGDAGRRLQEASAVLLATRERRVRPATDDKVLAAWNGHVLRALALGHVHAPREEYRTAGRELAAFVLRELVRDGRAFRAFHGGKARHAGVLEDHAALADGLLAWFELDGDPRWLDGAVGLLRTIEQHFAAPDGAFWSTADDAEALLARSKVAYDGATPSGTALATRALLRCGLLLGDAARYDRGVHALRAHHAELAERPAAVPALVEALQFHLGDAREVVIAGEPDDPRTAALERAARLAGVPQVVVVVHDGNRAALAERSPLFRDKLPQNGVPTAYVCRRGVCQAPISDPALLGRSR